MRDLPADHGPLKTIAHRVQLLQKDQLALWEQHPVRDLPADHSPLKTIAHGVRLLQTASSCRVGFVVDRTNWRVALKLQ